MCVISCTIQIMNFITRLFKGEGLFKGVWRTFLFEASNSHVNIPGYSVYVQLIGMM